MTRFIQRWSINYSFTQECFKVVRQQNIEFNHLLPFAVVGSTDSIVRESDGRTVRARRYPWGVVEVENEEHCDFVKLREALLRVNQDSLHERTHCILYERYRRERLKAMNMRDGDASGPGRIEAYLAVSSLNGGSRLIRGSLG